MSTHHILWFEIRKLTLAETTTLLKRIGQPKGEIVMWRGYHFMDRILVEALEIWQEEISYGKTKKVG